MQVYRTLYVCLIGIFILWSAPVQAGKPKITPDYSLNLEVKEDIKQIIPYGNKVLVQTYFIGKKPNKKYKPRLICFNDQMVKIWEYKYTQAFKPAAKISWKAEDNRDSTPLRNKVIADAESPYVYIVSRKDSRDKKQLSVVRIDSLGKGSKFNMELDQDEKIHLLHIFAGKEALCFVAEDTEDQEMRRVLLYRLGHNSDKVETIVTEIEYPYSPAGNVRQPYIQYLGHEGTQLYFSWKYLNTKEETTKKRKKTDNQEVIDLTSMVYRLMVMNTEGKLQFDKTIELATEGEIVPMYCNTSDKGMMDLFEYYNQRENYVTSYVNSRGVTERTVMSRPVAGSISNIYYDAVNDKFYIYGFCKAERNGKRAKMKTDIRYFIYRYNSQGEREKEWTDAFEPEIQEFYMANGGVAKFTVVADVLRLQYLGDHYVHTLELGNASTGNVESVRAESVEERTSDLVAASLSIELIKEYINGHKALRTRNYSIGGVRLDYGVLIYKNTAFGPSPKADFFLFSNDGTGPNDRGPLQNIE